MLKLFNLYKYMFFFVFCVINSSYCVGPNTDFYYTSSE